MHADASPVLGNREARAPLKGALKPAHAAKADRRHNIAHVYEQDLKTLVPVTPRVSAHADTCIDAKTNSGEFVVDGD